MILLPEPSFKPYRLFSAGWGTQSTAVLVLQAQGKVKPYDAFVWANVGDDSEHPETIEYYRNHIVPFAAQHNIKLIERQRIYKGKPITLYRFINEIKNAMPLPLYFSNGGKARRNCTVDFKIKVVNRYFKQEIRMTHVEMGIGFSRDEAYRIHKKYTGWHNYNYTRQPNNTWKKGEKLGFWRLHEFPLTELMLTKAQCIKLVMEAGLPEPPPSLCWFCPFQGRSRLLDKKKNHPVVFTNMTQMEEMLNERYRHLNNKTRASKFMGFHPDRIPLEEMPEQYELWHEYADADGCDLGICDV